MKESISSLDNVLMVDDEINFISALKRELRNEPYNIILATSAKEGLEILSKQIIKVVVSDELMPKMSGSEFLALVQQEYPNTVKIVLSGNSTLETAIKSINDGEIYRFFLKPCKTSELAATLRGAIKKYDTENLNSRALQSYQNLSSDAVITANQEGHIIFWNRAAEEMFGWSSQEAIGETFFFIMPERYREKQRQAIRRMFTIPENIADGKPIEIDGLRKDGSEFPIELALSTYSTKHGQYLTGIIHDIGEIIDLREKFEQARDGFTNVVENNRDGIVILVDGVITYVNHAFEELFPANKGKYIGQVFGFPIMVDSAVELDFIRPDSSLGTVEMRTWCTVLKNQDAILVTIRDISERKIFEAHLAEMANQDFLTKTVSRLGFEKILTKEIDRCIRYHEQGALLWFDLDGFKDINDSFGHKAGDDMLINIALMVRKRLRTNDTLARIGGDEFAVVLPKVDSDSVLKVAEKLRQSISAANMQINDRMVGVTASIGITLFPEHGRTAKEILPLADLAMYQAKNNGRNCCVMYDPGQGLPEESRNNVAWKEKIRSALKDDLFILYAQPIVNVTKKESHFEILLRMRDENCLIGPASFLPHGERCGLIRDIDRWVISNSLQRLAIIHQNNPDVHFSINFSGNSFQDENFISFIQNEISASGVEPKSLIFEITETAAIANIERAQQFIETLNKLGCQFALDDFGVGFSTFFHLKHLSIDYLKVDGSFIKNILSSKADQHIVLAMINVAKGLGKKIIAEWVEDEETYVLLQEMGVDYAQGFHLGRPEPVSEIWSIV